MQHDSVWYFAYGSNMDPVRFESRVGPWRSRRRARLDGYRLRFANSVRSEGGGAAVVDPSAGGSVDGVLFEMGTDQLEAMDREELDPDRDPGRVGRRMTVEVTTGDGSQRADLYTVDDGGGWLPPSEVYVTYLLDGLIAVDHCHHALAHVRRVASRASEIRRAGD